MIVVAVSLKSDSVASNKASVDEHFAFCDTRTGVPVEITDRLRGNRGNVSAATPALLRRAAFFLFVRSRAEYSRINALNGEGTAHPTRSRGLFDKIDRGSVLSYRPGNFRAPRLRGDRRIPRAEHCKIDS